MNHPTTRWALALGWVLFVGAYLLQEPGTPAVEVVAPVAAPAWQREVVFTIGHILGFGLMSVLWARVCALYTTPLRAVVVAAALTLGIGVAIEFAQMLTAGRNPSLYDVSADVVGIALASLGLTRVFHLVL